MEKQLLKLLDYRTWIQPEEFIETFHRFHQFDIHLLIRQASCVSEIKQYYLKQEPGLYLGSSSSSSSFGFSQDSLDTQQEHPSEFSSCPDSFFSLKDFAGQCELGKENMITIISDHYSNNSNNLEALVTTTPQ
ncbi:hypothetical protein BY458DRAFT_514740 [Sporodiniella umbellata]|nr:hypothetical protein BY458DRAFT_514740 [Sporodiniella umbellata]